jgi:hypothetical protein
MAISIYRAPEGMQLTSIAERVEIFVASFPANRRLAAALRVMHGAGGRPAIDDTQALDEMAALLAAGATRSVDYAAKLVARTIPARGAVLENVQRRLAKKFRTRNP